MGNRNSLMKMRRLLVVHTIGGLDRSLFMLFSLLLMLRVRNSLYNYTALPTQNEVPNDVMLGERNSLHNYFRGNEWPSLLG